MKILLANLPWRVGNRLGVRAGSRWPFTTLYPEKTRVPRYLPFPFFLAYATSLLESDGRFEVKLVDAITEGYVEDEFLEIVNLFKPDFVLFETSTPSIANDLSYCDKISKQNQNVRIALSGTHATVFFREILTENPAVSFILLGEYEKTLLELAGCLHENKEPEGIAGLSGRRSDGTIYHSGRRKLIDSLDSLPWPAYRHLPMLKYHDTPGGIPSPSVQMWASRGCPFGCIFCVWPQVMYGGGIYRVRQPSKVLDELEWLIAEYGFKSVYFDDDTFNIGKKRILEFCEEFKSRKIGIPWAIMARADTIDEETLVAMREAGMVSLKFGVESGVQEIINRSGKNLDLKKVRENVHAAKKLGIKVHLTFTFGLPGETHQTIRQTMCFLKELKPDTVQFSLATPFPGSKYFDELDSEGRILTKDWSFYDGAVKSVIQHRRISNRDLERNLYDAIHNWNKPPLTKRIWRQIPAGLRTYIKALILKMPILSKKIT